MMAEFNPGSGLAEVIANVFREGSSPRQSEELADAYDDEAVTVDWDEENTPNIVFINVGERQFKVTVEALYPDGS